jgi:hypothetical protein
VEGPFGFQEVEAPEFLDNRHMKVVSLSALRTGRLYPQDFITSSCTYVCGLIVNQAVYLSRFSVYYLNNDIYMQEVSSLVT